MNNPVGARVGEFERITIMNEKTFENFKKLSPEKQEELIVLMLKFLTYYQSIFAAFRQDENTKQQTVVHVPILYFETQ